MENFLNLMYFFGDAPAGDDLVGITFWLGTMAMMARPIFNNIPRIYEKNVKIPATLSITSFGDVHPWS